MHASIVITTRNRREELRNALRSAFLQTIEPEVIVLDDNSTDGTSGLVRTEFPRAVLYRFDQPRGYIVRRNEGARLATGDIIFSIDDDAAFSTPRVVEQTLLGFESPRIGAVALPYIDVRKDGKLRQIAPDTQDVWATDAFVGTAHAVRRNVFLKLGGYREHLVHQGEESDYCIRMLQAGYVVRLGASDPIHHFESPKRDLRRMDFYGPRNAVLFAWENVPRPWLPIHLMTTTIRCLLFSLRPGRFPVRLHGVVDGYRQATRISRRPVSGCVYKLHRRMKKNGALRFSVVDGELGWLEKCRGEAS